MWIPRKDALRVLSAADSLKYGKQILFEKQKDIDSLNARILLFETRLNGLMEISTNNEEIIQQMEGQLDLEKERRKLLEGEIKALNRKLRKQRRKTFWVAMGGAVTTTAAIFLFK